MVVILVLANSVIGLSQNPLREFRGAWIATVENIDWPSKPGLSVDEQKREFIELIDKLRFAGMNAAIVQIRPTADAFYPSPLEPWSVYLTGNMNQAPKPYYDPLLFMIEEVHKRGLEFHAWLNPYRALNNDDIQKLSLNHPKIRYPHLFVQYGGKHYFNPGEPRSRQHVTQVVKHLIFNYDIDAIHFDDYFYPYKVPGEDFPDQFTFEKLGGAFSNIEDWRRNNVNELIQDIHLLIKQNKPHIQFGISPFSVWRNMDKDPVNGSPTQAGQTCYDDLYADILLWLKKGWIDYVAPQLYFAIGFELIDPEIMMKWWAERSYSSTVYIGKAMYRVNSERKGWKDPDQIPDQIRLSRNIPKIDGSIYFSAKSVVANPLNVVDRLRSGVYNSIALLPVKRIITSSIPAQITEIALSQGERYVNVMWRTDQLEEEPYYYVIYRFTQGEIRNIENPQHIIGTTGFGTGEKNYIDRDIDPGNYVYIVLPANRDHVFGKPSNPVTVSIR